jgi:hypothetical protein
MEHRRRRRIIHRRVKAYLPAMCADLGLRLEEGICVWVGQWSERHVGRLIGVILWALTFKLDGSIGRTSSGASSCCVQRERAPSNGEHRSGIDENSTARSSTVREKAALDDRCTTKATSAQA